MRNRGAAAFRSMMKVIMIRTLMLPRDNRLLPELNAGEEVLLSGTVLTMRDAALERTRRLLEEGGELPFDPAGRIILHAGPTPPHAGRPAGAIGPTTSARMDRFLEMIFRLGVVGTLGKGPRSTAAAAIHRDYQAVYLSSVGGLGALFGTKVASIETVAWDELGPEAVKEVVLRGFPAIVAISSTGEDYLASIYAQFELRS